MLLLLLVLVLVLLLLPLGRMTEHAGVHAATATTATTATTFVCRQCVRVCALDARCGWPCSKPHFLAFCVFFCLSLK